MQIQWSQLFLKTAAWFCAEIVLTCLGLDDLADYSEFIFQDRHGVPSSEFSIDFAPSAS